MYIILLLYFYMKVNLKALHRSIGFIYERDCKVKSGVRRGKRLFWGFGDIEILMMANTKYW